MKCYFLSIIDNINIMLYVLSYNSNYDNISIDNNNYSIGNSR